MPDSRTDMVFEQRLDKATMALEYLKLWRDSEFRDNAVGEPLRDLAIGVLAAFLTPD